MKKITMIIEKFDASIAKFEKSNQPQLIQLNEKIKIAQDCLNELRQEVKLNVFSSPKKEILFFKKQKPYIKGHLKFYVKSYKYELEKPIGSKSEQRKFVEIQLSLIALEQCKHIDFVNYLLLEKTKNDHIYFLRGEEQFEFFIDNTTVYEDPDFSTTRDHLTSKIIANNLLNQFFTNELESLKKQNFESPKQNIQTTNEPCVTWTGTNIGLIEVLFSLKEFRAINNGNITIKELKMFAEKTFNQNFGNFYKSYGEIRSRKTETTKFLDKLKEALQNKIDSDEDV